MKRRYRSALFVIKFLCSVEVPSGPNIKLLVYPPPPNTGGIAVHRADLRCLGDAQFLNDVIIDFYRKYLMREKACEEVQRRTHVFSSFFYPRLTQRLNHRAQGQAGLTPDFIVVPINQSSHWFLAMVRFPGLVARSCPPQEVPQEERVASAEQSPAYVESFLENPPNLGKVLKLDLGDWFPEDRVAQKRANIRDLILRLHVQQHPGSDFPDQWRLEEEALVAQQCLQVSGSDDCDRPQQTATPTVVFTAAPVIKYVLLLNFTLLYQLTVVVLGLEFIINKRARIAVIEVAQFSQKGGNDNRDAARKVLARFIEEQVAKQCSWKGSGGLKESLFLLENILAMIHGVGGQDEGRTSEVFFQSSSSRSPKVGLGAAPENMPRVSHPLEGPQGIDRAQEEHALHPQLNPSKSSRVLDLNRVAQFSQKGGNDNRDAARKVLARFIEEQVAKQCSWKGSGGLKESLFLLENILAMIHVLQFKCTVCEKSFSTLKGLRVHASLKKHGRQDGVRVEQQGGDGDIGDSVGVVVDTDTLSAVRATLAVTFGEAGTGLLAGATGAQAAVASFSPRSGEVEVNQEALALERGIELEVIPSALSQGEGQSEPRDVGEFSRSLDGVSQDSRQVAGGASSGGQIHDGAAGDAPKFHTCPECARAFTSARGLTQHVRHAHRTLYNERIDVHRIKPRWDREEEYLLAKKEVELGSSCTNINQVLHSHFPSRSLEAIKSHRKDLNYRETVQRLAAETALRLTDSGAGSGGVCPRVVRTRELREGAPRSEGGAAVTTCPVDPVLQHRGALQSSPVPQSQLDFVAQGARPRRPLRSCRRDRLQPSVEVVLPESSGTSELPDPPSRGDDLGDVVTPGGVVTHVVQQPQRSRSPSESPSRILRRPSSPLRDQSQASSEERVVRATPAAVAGPPPGAPGATVAGAPGGGAAAAAGDGSGSALLIYLKEPTPTSANDIRVMLKKYFEPQRLGLKEVAMREIRNGIAVQSQCLESLQRLADAIQEHPTTKDAFVLSQPSKRKPQFRVTGVDPDIHPAELLTALRAQNPDAQLEATEYHHRTSYKEKSGNCTHIFDVNADGFKKLEGKTRSESTAVTSLLDAAPGVNPVVASALKQYAVLKDSMITLMKRHAKSLSHESWTDLSKSVNGIGDALTLVSMEVAHLQGKYHFKQVTGEWEGRVREIEAELKAEGEKRVGLEAQVEELTGQLIHEREQRVGLEKQAEELGEIWKAGLGEPAASSLGGGWLGQGRPGGERASLHSRPRQSRALPEATGRGGSTAAGSQASSQGPQLQEGLGSHTTPSREALLRALRESVEEEPPEKFQGHRLWDVAREAISGADFLRPINDYIRDVFFLDQRRSSPRDGIHYSEATGYRVGDRMGRTVAQFSQKGGNDNRDAARKVLARFIEEQVAKQCSWKGSGGLKESLFLLENILAMIHGVGGQDEGRTSEVFFQSSSSRSPKVGLGALNVNVKRFIKARVNGGSNYDSLLTDSGAGSGGVCPRVVRTRELREGAPRSEGGAAVTTCPVDPVLQHRGALQSSPVPQSQLDFVAQGARPRRPLRSCRRDRLQPSVEVVLPESSGTSELPDPPSRGDDLGDVVTPGGVVTHVVQQPQRSRSPSESPSRILRRPSSPLRDQSQASSEEREPTPTSANDIRVMLKKYFEPQRLGLKEVVMREIRNGIAVQSQCLESLQRLADAIQEHPTTKDAFVLSQPSKRKPQFRVTGVDPDIHPEELLTALRAQNPDAQLEATEYHHRTSYKEKSGNCTHIFDVNADGFKKLEGKTRYFAQIMAMVGRQTTEIEVLKAKLEERGKVSSHADALMGRVEEGTAPLPAAQPAAPQPGAKGTDGHRAPQTRLAHRPQNAVRERIE
ncbi:uncharacterized protein ISCGN_001423 [Ixodes scapularis]